ncbi:MAG: DUF3786 domain-containing protein [Desulfurivibrionaceae bacterium]|nr:DUF3786 domain-containing protein [Desulfurivibrionaceae bacterium]
MTLFKSPLELYKLLPQTNCRKCGLPSCLAFAAAVIKGDKRLEACPHLTQKILDTNQGKMHSRGGLEQEENEAMAHLEAQVANLDLAEAAQRCGGVLKNNKIRINCLGNKFEINSRGKVTSLCHTNAWFTVPLLNYLLRGKGATPTGDWVSFRDLPGGGEWNPLYLQRCEKPLKQLADCHAELFADLIDIFSGQQPAHHFDADIVVQLFPYPKLPILICYWQPEEDLPSKLQILYDTTAEANLPIDSLYRLGAGLACMLAKISQRHIQ